MINIFEYVIIKEKGIRFVTLYALLLLIGGGILLGYQRVFATFSRFAHAGMEGDLICDSLRVAKGHYCCATNRSRRDMEIAPQC